MPTQGLCEPPRSSKDTRPLRPLEAKFPRLAEIVTPLRLGEFPTPLWEAPAISRPLRLRRVTVKRDDLSSRLYGGTKVRALEFLLAEVLRSGAKGVLTVGPRGSHHVLATTLFARMAGLGVRAVVFPGPETAETLRNFESTVVHGAEVISVRSVLQVPLALARARRRKSAGSPPPWFIPGGGSSPLGVLGAVEGALEVTTAIDRGEIERPDAIVVAAGSCGTAAGLWLGLALAGHRIPLFSVRVATRFYSNGLRIRHLARGAGRLIRNVGGPSSIEFGPLEVLGGELGRGYGRPTSRGLEAMGRAQAAGLRADPTYTGKAWASLTDPRFSGLHVLFWQTLSAVEAPLPGPSDDFLQEGMR